eukprot:jgi/Mesen1/3153/ME000184S02211
MVPRFASHGAYFSFSGLITSLKAGKAKAILDEVPEDRLLLETDCPDALPRTQLFDSRPVPDDPSTVPSDADEVLREVASLMEQPPEDIAKRAYANALRVFAL